MSRSYKKTPMVKDRNKGMKRVANKKIRNNCYDVPNGKAYRKFFCSYDISDFAFTETLQEFIDRYERNYRAYLNGAYKYFKKMSYKEIYWEWYSCYKKK